MGRNVVLRSRSRGKYLGAFAIFMMIGPAVCSPGAGNQPANASDPSSLQGEFVTYVADFEDGHSSRWHALRTADGREIPLEFDAPPTAVTGMQVQVHGATIGEKLRVSQLDLLPSAARMKAEPDLYAAPAQDTYALVLVDLGSGVDKTAAQGQTYMFSTTATDKSFASYYNEVSYGKYTVSGDVIGPFSFTMTTCDTSGMYKAIEPQITGTYNHLIYYFNKSSLCDWGGLGEEGSISRPAKRTWMNGSLSCVVLMQEPGHNLGLMHANTIKCGTASFSTTPATSCTITEYGSTMSTMGGGCKQFNAYERWYMQWLTGCNGVRVPGSGTFNLLPLETSCPGGVQVLQVPFPATLVVNDPQATTTNVNLKDYYVELRTAGGIFDAYSTSTRGVIFSGPTVFIYVSDDVHPPATTGRGTNSVWTELINTTPSGTSYTGLTAAGQSFADPAGGPTITLQSISTTGATIVVSNALGSGASTCIDGTALAEPGPTSCGATGTGGTPGTGGSSGTGGTAGATGAGGAGGANTTTTIVGTGGSRDASPGTDASTRRDVGGPGATGGATGGGGTTVAGGTGGGAGASGSSGNVGSGGSAGSGGKAGSGGSAGSGGNAGSGGSPGTGGSAGSGGSTGSAGSGGSGGASGSGGSGGTQSASTSMGSDQGGSTGATSPRSTVTGCNCRLDAGQASSPAATWFGLAMAALFVALQRRRGRR